MGGACSTYGGEEGAYRVLVGTYEGRRPLGRPGIDERIILRLIFRKVGRGGACTGMMWLRIGSGGGHL
jgi:hypothetical protein